MADGLVLATWSGGIDSTAVVAQLLRRGRSVRSVALDIYKNQQPLMWDRERSAREKLTPHLQDIADDHGASFSHEDSDGQWLWAFSPDGVEIPNRNRHIIDHLISRFCMRDGLCEIALGEYLGADSWVVQDHVSANDADSRSLASYLFLQWGLGYRLWTMTDFGECRYKHDRLSMLYDVLGGASVLTTNCLHDCCIHCGECYKCVERSVAFELCGVDDSTEYKASPLDSEKRHEYLSQMKGVAE